MRSELIILSFAKPTLNNKNEVNHAGPSRLAKHTLAAPAQKAQYMCSTRSAIWQLQVRNCNLRTRFKLVLDLLCLLLFARPETGCMHKKPVRHHSELVLHGVLQHYFVLVNLLGPFAQRNHNFFGLIAPIHIQLSDNWSVARMIPGKHVLWVPLSSR